MRRIGGLLGRSPYGPLHEQMAKVTACVEEVPKLLRRMAEGDKKRARAAIKRIRKLEHDADEVKSAIRGRLSNSLFSSVVRSEVLGLVNMIDSIADNAEKVAKLVAVRWTTVPKHLGGDLADLGGRALDSVRRVVEVSGGLRELMDGSSSRREATKLLDTINRLGEFGFEVEEKEIEVLKLLFENEGEASPVDLMFLMRIISQVADISRQSWNVGDAIRRLVLNR